MLLDKRAHLKILQGNEEGYEIITCSAFSHPSLHKEKDALETSVQTRKPSTDERSVKEEKSQSNRAGFHWGLASASVRRGVLTGQSSFASATGHFTKGAASTPSPCSAGYGQLQHLCRSKHKAASAVHSPSCAPREAQGGGKTRAKIRWAGWQLIPVLKNHLGSDRAELLRSSASVTCIKRASKTKTSLSEG